MKGLEYRNSTLMFIVHRQFWLGVLTTCLLTLPTPVFAADLLIFAASSLKPALDEWLARPDVARIGTIRASYAASSQLARQIDNAAPADLFISADQQWMDHLAANQRIVDGSRSDLLGNALVMIARKDSTITMTIEPGMRLALALGADGRLAMAEPNSVPAGRYAKSALISMGAWPSVNRRLVAADNVRAAFNFVARGEVALGIVYRSDTVGEDSVRVIGTFPESSHAPIRYPAAIVSGHDGVATRQLLALLKDETSTSLFRRHGFDAPPKNDR